MRTLIASVLSAAFVPGLFSLVIPAQAANVIRLDDLLSSAAVQAPHPGSAVTAVEPVVWQNFFQPSDLKWQLVRGEIGRRNGDMMITGSGSVIPAIQIPADFHPDWNEYEAIEIRMSATSGREIKLSVRQHDTAKPLGPAGVYNLYRFDLPSPPAKGSYPLVITPTDDPAALVAIHSIKLIPRPAAFLKPYGRESVGKRDEYRQTIYLHTPATLTFAVTLPSGAHLRFGAGILSHDAPVTFRVAVDGSEVAAKPVTDSSGWTDTDVDLSRYAGRNVKLSLRADGSGGIAFWANPLLIGAGSHPRPNVLIYMIDTLRADHSNVYGYSRATMPFLSKFAGSGVVFDDAQAQAAWTKPSVASLMTSLYSFTHGVRNAADTIPSGAPTLAEQIRASGYVTASIIGTPLVGRNTGLDRGFDYMDESGVAEREFNAQRDRATNSRPLNSVVFPWLERHRDEPFFLYVHATDPHSPYDPPVPENAAWAKPGENALFQRDYMSFHTETEHGGAPVFNREMCVKAGLEPDRFIQQAIDRYDGEILHADRSFQALIEKLRQLGTLNNTVVIVLSDHGEEFWDHGWTGHEQSLYQELTHTVFTLWNPSLFPKPRRVSEPVQLIDVMPTVLELLNVTPPRIMEGQSLLALAQGRAWKRRGPVMSSRFAPGGTPGPIPENAVDSFAIIDRNWKFIYRNHAAKVGINKVELYDRAHDRTEKHDIAEQHPELIEQDIAALNQWLDAQKKIVAIIGHSGATQLDRKTIEQLKSLGYVGGP